MDIVEYDSKRIDDGMGRNTSYYFPDYYSDLATQAIGAGSFGTVVYVLFYFFLCMLGLLLDRQRKIENKA